MQETQETWVQSLGQEDPLEKEMAIHSSILAWKIPWTEEPSELQSMGWQRVRHDRERNVCAQTHIDIVTVTVRGGILICSGCRNKNAIDWVSLTTEINFLMVLGTERKSAHVL